MRTPQDIGADTTNAPNRVSRYITVSLFGLLVIVVGVATDYVLDANNSGLTVDGALLSVGNLGHLLLGIGIVATAVGLALAATNAIDTTDGDSTTLRFGRIALGVCLVVLVVSLVYVVTGPGLGNSHSNGVSDALLLSDGVDRSRLPSEEALALATLAWSRPGSLAEDAGMVHLGMEDDMVSMGSGQNSGSEEALADELALATGALPRLDTIAEVEAQGYVQASNVSDGSGAHWVKWTLVDKPFDPENPSMLLFDELTRGEPMELIAHSYWVASDGPPEGFPGNTDEWHPPVGMCFQNGWLKDDNLPDRRSCAGDWVNGSDLWMLHAWIVPGVENEFGQFATVNPLLCERACGLEN